MVRDQGGWEEVGGEEVEGGGNDMKLQELRRGEDMYAGGREERKKEEWETLEEVWLERGTVLE